jgi:hypothetical protein
MIIIMMIIAVIVEGKLAQHSVM